LSNRADLYREFLKFYWLRPENAIMLGVRGDAFASTLDLINEGEDSIDVSCGDGVYSYITMGGTFSNKPDQFRAVSFKKTFREGDYDAYDHFDDSYRIEITKRPEHHFIYGADWKDNLLQKAKALDFYDNLLFHDNNNPLPLEDGSIGYAYTNSSYWVPKFEEHLQDLVRILKPGGHLVLQMRTNKIKDYSLADIAPELGAKFHKIAEAGRVNTWKGLRPRDELMNIIGNLDGAKIVRDEPVLGQSIANIWNLGLRPLFNPLVKMANSLDIDARSKIKDEWCYIFEEMFTEYVENYQCTEEDAFEFLIVLEKT